MNPMGGSDLAKDDLDLLQTNLIGNIQVQDLSARIDALARDMISEESQSSSGVQQTTYVVVVRLRTYQVHIVSPLLCYHPVRNN